MIETDLGRFNLKKEKDLKKYGDIIFSNLITFGNNMKSLEIDKRIIIKIMDEFIEKYNFISESNIKIIFETILQETDEKPLSNDELNKLRKEYDISLENENLENNDNEEDKIEEKKEENKEEKKEENKEKKKEEKKEEENKEENKDNPPIKGSDSWEILENK